MVRLSHLSKSFKRGRKEMIYLSIRNTLNDIWKTWNQTMEGNVCIELTSEQLKTEPPSSVSKTEAKGAT